MNKPPNWSRFVPRYDQLYFEGDTGSAWDNESHCWRTFKNTGSEDWPVWEPVAESAQHDQQCEMPPKENAA